MNYLRLPTIFYLLASLAQSILLTNGINIQVNANQENATNPKNVVNQPNGDDGTMVDLVNKFWEDNRLHLNSNDLVGFDHIDQQTGKLLEREVQGTNDQQVDQEQMQMMTNEDVPQANARYQQPQTIDLLESEVPPEGTNYQGQEDDRIIEYDRPTIRSNEDKSYQVDMQLDQSSSTIPNSTSSLDLGLSAHSTNLTEAPQSTRQQRNGLSLIARAMNNLSPPNQNFSRPPYAANYDTQGRSNQLYSLRPIQSQVQNKTSRPIFDERVDLLEEPANKFDPSIAHSRQAEPVQEQKASSSQSSELKIENMEKKSIQPNEQKVESETHYDEQRRNKFNKFASYSIDLSPIPGPQSDFDKLNSPSINGNADSIKSYIPNEGSQLYARFPSNINTNEPQSISVSDHAQKAANLVLQNLMQTFNRPIESEKSGSSYNQEKNPSLFADSMQAIKGLNEIERYNNNSSLKQYQQSNMKRTPQIGVSDQSAPVLWARQPINSADRNNANYPASLINVTAPMVLPLSASESMETDAVKLGLSGSLASQLASAGRTQPNNGRPNLGNDNPGVEMVSRSTPPSPAPQNSGWRQQQPPTVSPAPTTPSQTTVNLENARSDGFVNELASKSHASRPHNIQHASGFRSPPFHLNSGASSQTFNQQHVNSFGSFNMTNQMPQSYWAAPNSLLSPQPSPLPSQSSTTSPAPRLPTAQAATSVSLDTNYTTNGFITADQSSSNTISSSHPTNMISTNYGQQLSDQGQQQTNGNVNNLKGIKRQFNLTRVEHISAECSNDLIRTVIIFNGTFKGLIYSSGYVRDSECIYVNGTGKTRYDFSIRLNQCGTLGRQEIHAPTGANDIRRRDQVMWNALSIQYNPIIEQEWDEHFRVSCEYGSDFWKTISFSPFNVETNTGSPVVFTVDPPQCQMEVRRGHNMVGPRQEAVLGPVTVGDPLTLLIHMKSEKAGYDILVRNCVAHNGGHQKMQLIDSNGCVVNERFISPFRGTYNDQDLKQVTLYAYLKAFRFTGSPVLYLECEIHMCQSACPPQMCYWRQLSKRSADYSEFNITETGESLYRPTEIDTIQQQVDGEFTVWKDEDEKRKGLAARQGRNMKGKDNEKRNNSVIADSVNLFQALEVRQNPESELSGNIYDPLGPTKEPSTVDPSEPLVCYRHAQLLAYLFAIASIVLVALSVSIGCCWRARELKNHRKLEEDTISSQRRQRLLQLANDNHRYQSANMCLYSSQFSGDSNKLKSHRNHQYQHNRGLSSPESSKIAYCN